MINALTSIWAFKLSLTLALLLLWLGYSQRHAQRRHMALGIAAAAVTLLAAVYLVVLVELLGVQFHARVPMYVVHLHRLFSAATLLLVGHQLVTGLWRLPRHRLLAQVLLAFYTVSVVSGWLIF